MPRTRVIYQNEALYVGPSPATSGHYKFITGNNAVNVPTQKLSQLDPLSVRTVNSGSTTASASLAQMTSGLAANITNLDRIQSINYNFNISRKDVNQFGALAAIDRVIIDQPTVSLDFSYFQNSFANEKELGFDVKALKRSATVNLTIVASGDDEFGITAASIADGGQGYLNPFTLTLPQQPPNVSPVLSFGVATGGLFAGQATGVSITNQGSGVIFINGLQISPPTISIDTPNIPVNVGIGGTSDGKDFSPTLANNYPEGTTGVLNVTCLSGILTKVTDDKNMFVRTVAQGNDVTVATTGTLDQAIIAFGNVVMNNYATNGAVGDFPTVTVGNEARNISFHTGANNFKSSAAGQRYGLPSLDSNGSRVNGTFSLPDFNDTSDLTNNVSVFKPGSIVLDLSQYALSGFGIDTSSASLNAQSYSLSIAMQRDSLKKLGNTFEFSKEITFPINYSLSVDVLVSDLVVGNLLTMVTGKDVSFDVSISHIKPGTENSSLGRITGAKYTAKSTLLESMSFSSSIGANKTATLTFGGQISSPQDSTKGILMHGDHWMQISDVI
jgi:hypothetical protein